MKSRGHEAHVMVLPYPSQGHINPMLQFSRRLASVNGRLKVTFLVAATDISFDADSSINIEAVCEGLEKRRAEESTEKYVKRLKVAVSQGLPEFIMEKKKSEESSAHPARVILVYDSMMPWAGEVAKPLGLDGVPFFTQSCAVSAIYYHLHKGELRMPLEGSGTVSVPSMPLLGMNDLPSFVHGDDKFILGCLLDQFLGFQEVKWILFNTFDKLEDEVMKWMKSSVRPIKTIGPTVPSMYLDKRLEENKDYCLSLFKEDTKAYIDWLDKRNTGSVLYASFGSNISLGEEQMQEIAWGLKNSNAYFIWVVRESEEKKLPNKFLGEETTRCSTDDQKGLVVSWCCQLQVLSHRAVGCFMSHCGWNSTLEALSFGVPVIAMPQISDQATNAKFIEDVWEVGIRVKGDDDEEEEEEKKKKKKKKGVVVKREEIEVCIREMMEGERGREVRKNAEMWKESAVEAVSEGGTSHNHIQDFVDEILCS